MKSPGRRRRRSSLALALPALFGLAACGSPGEPSASVHRITVERCTGVDKARATGVTIAGDNLGTTIVATVAHSFEDAKTISLQSSTEDEFEATVIYLDADKDIALLRVTGGDMRSMSIADPTAETDVSIISFAEEDGPVEKPAVILDLVDATLDGEGRRAAVKLQAEVEAGDSGAPVVDGEGNLVAMVFATARGGRIGWAIAGAEVAAALEATDVNRPGDIPLAC